MKTISKLFSRTYFRLNVCLSGTCRWTMKQDALVTQFSPLKHGREPVKQNVTIDRGAVFAVSTVSGCKSESCCECSNIPSHDKRNRVNEFHCWKIYSSRPGETGESIAGLYRSLSVSLFHTGFQDFYYILVRRSVLKFGLKLSNKTNTEQFELIYVSIYKG